MRKFIALTLGALIAFSTPFAMANSTTQSIGIGEHNLGFVTEGGQLIMWGRNEYGDFGTGETGLGGNYYDFTESIDGVVAVACGTYYSTMVLKIDGTLWTTGRNNSGQIGNSTTADTAEFVKAADNVVKIGGGSERFIFLKTDGTLWGMGNSSDHALITIPEGSSSVSTPILIAEGVKDFSTGYRNTGYINNNNELYVFGSNAQGQLGIGNTESSWNLTLPIKVLDDVRSVSAGCDYFLAVKNDNTLWAWGKNDYGQLMSGTTSYDNGYVPLYTPTKVADNVLKACAGDDNSAYINLSNELYFAGHNLYAEAGYDTTLAGIIDPAKIADNVADVAVHNRVVYTTLDDKTYTAGHYVNNIGYASEGFKEQPYVIAPEYKAEISSIPAPSAPVADDNVITLQIGSTTLKNGGNETALDVPAQTINGRTMVPLRAIFEALGATVEWDDATQTVTAIKGDIIIKLQIDSNVLNKNDEAITLDVPAQLLDGRTMVPARAVAEAFGSQVGWDDTTQTVTITK